MPLALTRGVTLSLKYELETESNIELVLSVYQSFLLTPLPLIPISQSLSLPPLYEAMSQHDLNMIIRQQQKQLVAM